MFTTLTDATYKDAFAATPAGVCIFFKKLCPHCKNMEKVLEKFAARVPEAALFAVDTEENPAASAACGAERAPTIVVIKDGAVAGSKAGLMNPKEMLAFYEQA